MRITLTILFLGLLLFVSCNRKKTGSEERIQKEIQLNHDLTDWATTRADSLLVTLTLEERVGQCIMPSLPANEENSTIIIFKNYIEDYHIGGIVLLGGTLDAAERLSSIAGKAKLPLFVAIDAEWGLGMRLVDAPVYPKNGVISKNEEESYLFDYGQEIATQCRDAGINMVLGPVIDLKGENILGSRSFGDDPDLVANYGCAYAKGLESGGVISVAKHFPGHGSTKTDSHKGRARVERDLSALDSMDLKPFRLYIDSGLSGMMVGHLEVRSLDPERQPASVSPVILTSLLREEMGFKGIVMTDAFDMEGAKGHSVAEALKAGADIVICPNDVKKEYEETLRTIKNGDLDIKILNDRCRRILFFKYLFHIIRSGE